MEIKTFIIRCSVCGTKTGTIELPEESPIDVETAILADMGIADSRCDDHPA